MSLEASADILDTLRPSTESDLPKVRQLYLNLYRAIEDGRLAYQWRLPSTRELATRFGVARNTVISVYEQLTAEGLLTADGRRGTRVARRVVNLPRRPDATFSLSMRAKRVVSRGAHHPKLAPGEPDSSLFPARLWRRAQNLASERMAESLGYRSSSLPQLQRSIARYLSNYRSLSVDPEQVVVTASTRQSLTLTAQLFGDVGDSAWVECPGYLGAVDAFRQCGLDVLPCRLDRQGLMSPGDDVPHPKLLYLTPCFQYPEGMTLGAARREDILERAHDGGTVVFEDDYDSEFRDDAQPRPALASERNGGNVIHAGTFSKLLFPAVRVGWMVVPDAYVTAAHRSLRAIGGGNNTLAQAAIAELLENGELNAHLTRARQVYGHRRRALVDALARTARFEPVGDLSGSLSLVLKLKSPVQLQALEQQLDKHGIGAQPLERLDWQKARPRVCRAIVVGLGNVDVLSMDDAVALLSLSIESAGRAGGRRSG